jgi:peptidoglycan/xylan/chitin deacetylase (PgdA/CDA1 family)
LTGFVSTNGTQALDTVNKIQGTGAIAHTLVGASGSVYDTKAAAAIGSVDPATLGVIVSLHNNGWDPEYMCTSQQGSLLGKGGSYYTQASVTTRAVSDLSLGWQTTAYDVSEVSTLVPGAAALGVRISNSAAAPYAGIITNDAVVAKAGGMPTVVLTFDDCYIEVRTIAYPMMAALGMVGTVYVAPGYLGTAGHMTLSDLQFLAAQGWDMQCNGTMNDGNMTLEADMESAINGTNGVNVVKNYVISNGLNSNPQHMCYPFGAVRAAGNRVQIASVVSDGSTTVTWGSGEDATTWVGRKFASSAIASPGLTVVSGGVGSAVLSGTVPAFTRPASFTDTSGPFHTGKLTTRLKSEGYKSGRLTNSGVWHTRWLGGGDRALAFPSLSGSAATAASLQPQVDQAVLRGSMSHHYFHTFDTGSGLSMLSTEFQLFLNSLASMRSAGTIDILTMAQWWARDGNSTLPV